MCGMLVFFTNLSLMEFQVRSLALFLLFSVIDGFEWFWMESLHKNIQLRVPQESILHFSCCILMTFMIMLSVILLSMLTILLSILSVIRHLICGNNLNWLLNLNLIYETLWTGIRSGLFQFQNCRFQCWENLLVSVDRSSNNGSVDVKMYGSVLEEKSSSKMLWLAFSSELDWVFTLSLLLKLPLRKLEL